MLLGKNNLSCYRLSRLKTKTLLSDGLFPLESPYRSTRKHRRTIMQVTTSAIINGEFADQYGKRGSQFSENGMLI
ncbi:MAG: hypothetical protein D8H97_12380 [Neisseria sp.]|nr:MAG: hypothetical protein D8H97_12380 [Neisseria sp.]